ncbi:MAG: hypothetical protein HYS86_04040 [Candidatus Chisholmbacteria bacterium]|nr:hypothetical protein [Candidatus Chisholmbacteria bacterium]
MADGLEPPEQGVNGRPPKGDGLPQIRVAGTELAKHAVSSLVFEPEAGIRISPEDIFVLNGKANGKEPYEAFNPERHSGIQIENGKVRLSGETTVQIRSKRWRYPITVSRVAVVSKRASGQESLETAFKVSFPGIDEDYGSSEEVMIFGSDRPSMTMREIGTLMVSGREV